MCLGTLHYQGIRGYKLTVRVPEHEVGQPPQTVGLCRISGNKTEYGVRDRLWIVGVRGMFDRRTNRTVFEERSWCGRDRTESFEGGIDRLGVDDANTVRAERGENLDRDLRTRQEQTASAAYEAAVGERDRERTEGLAEKRIGDHVRQRTVEGSPPSWRLLSPELIDNLCELDSPCFQGVQGLAIFAAVADQSFDNWRENGGEVVVGTFYDDGIPWAQEVAVDRAEQLGFGEAVEDLVAEHAVERAGGEAGGDQVQHVVTVGGSLAEQFGVRGCCFAYEPIG
ncbi:hypothetical protein GCM10009804_63930 [Kribbella hippodromi]|uniref:Uncharacterized protein n=1 Tax=Kribbella hippodromi TaxID=434347 RepID=A0ABP4Q3A2_9ACTN